MSGMNWPDSKSWDLLFNEHVAAEVPRVQLSRRDWREICQVISTIGTLHRLVHGDIAHSVIGGGTIAESAKLAESLMNRLGIAEEDN